MAPVTSAFRGILKTTHISGGARIDMGSFRRLREIVWTLFISCLLIITRTSSTVAQEPASKRAASPKTGSKTISDEKSDTLTLVGPEEMRAGPDLSGARAQEA